MGRRRLLYHPVGLHMPALSTSPRSLHAPATPGTWPQGPVQCQASGPATRGVGQVVRAADDARSISRFGRGKATVNRIRPGKSRIEAKKATSHLLAASQHKRLSFVFNFSVFLCIAEPVPIGVCIFNGSGGYGTG